MARQKDALKVSQQMIKILEKSETTPSQRNAIATIKNVVHKTMEMVVVDVPELLKNLDPIPSVQQVHVSNESKIHMDTMARKGKRRNVETIKV